MVEKKGKYFRAYRQHEELFYLNFKERAESYWSIYEDHYAYGLTYEDLAEKYYYSTNSIPRIVRKVEKFLSAPEENLDDPHIWINYVLSREVVVPNAFTDRTGSSVGTQKWFWIYGVLLDLYRREKLLCIPKPVIRCVKAQYNNSDRMSRLIEELRSLVFYLENGENVKVFERINVDRKAIRFEFTDHFLWYIWPVRFIA